MTALNAFEGERWETDKSNEKIAMDEQFVKNSVIDVNVDPKVVMDLSIFQIGGWSHFQHSIAKLAWRIQG